MEDVNGMVAAIHHQLNKPRRDIYREDKMSGLI